MARVELPEYMKECRPESEESPDKCGPFITISRQYGCHGFSLGLLLQEVLSDWTEPPNVWQVYHRDILSRLATETNLAEEILQRELRSKPHYLVDFFRSFGSGRLPSGMEIRKRITTIMRGLAVQGHAILIGQGGSGACYGLPNGLSVRLEAPEDWRVKQVADSDGTTEQEARTRILNMEREREYLRTLFEVQFPRKPAFNLVYDASVFSLTQIAKHIVCAMRIKGILRL